MKWTVLSLSVCMVLFSSTGCDAVRKLTGRPTSKELEQLREEKLLQEQALLERQKREADSLAQVQKELEEEARKAGALRTGNRVIGTLENKYYVIVGAFKVQSNAENFIKEVKEAGYEAVIVDTENGFHNISVCQTDNLNVALRARKRVLTELFCPTDAWILVNE